MTIDAEARARVEVPALTLPLTIAATFLSAALLFSVQPMFTKLVLPILGGSPSVWSIAMVFFQGLLLCGYGYAHLLTRWAKPRWALPIHVLLMAVAMLTLPIAIPEGWVKAPPGLEAPWLLALFGLVVGLPFFALSANGPLLQAWFARTGHKDAKDPYFLYAASNIGSFASLLLYPVAIEPILKVKEQTGTWMAGFVVLTALIALAGWQMLRTVGPETVARSRAEPVAWADRARWIGLAFVPSGLLVAVTAHISTDVAAVPLLWVLPLALFLLTFVLVFSSKPLVPTGTLIFLQVIGTAATLFSLVLQFDVWLVIGINLATFFVSAMVCHSALYARRPPAAKLTEFYFFMSLGGCLGGIFAGLIAPMVFTSVLEYPVLLVAALFCRPGFVAKPRELAGAAIVAAVLIAIGYALAMTVVPGVFVQAALVFFFAVALTVTWKAPPLAGVAAVATALCATLVTFSAEPVQAYRSFFGVHRILERKDGDFRVLMSGTTVHGAARREESGKPEPLAYYTPDGPLGVGIATMRAARGTLSHVALIGLGSGSLTCHAEAGEDWRYFEIDPQVIDIAETQFPFLSGCGPDVTGVLGDARLTFAETTVPNDLIVLDAFSSDSIPAHLITVEALRLYLDRLAPGGAILVHTSNRNLELTHILARAAAEVGLVAYKWDDHSDEPVNQRFRLRSVAMMFARDPQDLGTLATSWERIEPQMHRRPWTDDFSNILEAILDKR